MKAWMIAFALAIAVVAPAAAAAEPDAKEVERFVAAAIRSTRAEIGKQRTAWTKERAALAAQLRSAKPADREKIRARMDALAEKLAGLDEHAKSSVLIPEMQPPIKEGTIGRLPEPPKYVPPKPGQVVRIEIPSVGYEKRSEEAHRVSGTIDWRHPRSGKVHQLPLAKPLDLTPHLPAGYRIVESLD